MPVRLGENSRAHISEEFITAMATVRHRRVVGTRDEIRKAESEVARRLRLHDPGSFQVTQARNQLAILRKELLTTVGKENDGDVASAGRAGSDYQITRLHRLPYTHFAMRKDGSGGEFFVGSTRPVFTEPFLYRGETRRLDLGPYFVCVSADHLGGTYRPSVHLIPERAPLIGARSLHHVSDTAAPGTNPLDTIPRTCWGGFNNVIQSSWYSADVPEIFSMLHSYLTRVNPNDALAGIHSLTFANLERVQDAPRTRSRR